jgi:hypothetical protein
MAKFDSTILPQTNDPKEIQKLALDLLDKINQTYSAIPVIPSTGGPFAPLPQAAAGVGQDLLAYPAAGAAWVLPAGGTWEYFGFAVGTGAGNVNLTTAVPVGGIAAGGTTVGAATALYQWVGREWRIA